MEANIEFKNQPLKVAEDFLHEYNVVDPHWKFRLSGDGVGYGKEVEEYLRAQFKGGTRALPMLKGLVGKVSGPSISVVIADVLVTKSIDIPDSWKQNDEIVRSVLRMSAHIDLGINHANDINFSVGGPVEKSKETQLFENLIDKLKEQVSPSIGENRIS